MCEYATAAVSVVLENNSNIPFSYNIKLKVYTYVE